MRRKFGAVCIVLGIALLLGAVGLALYNRQEDRSAGESAQSVMPELVEQIRENTRQTLPASEIMPELELHKPVKLLTEEEKKMTEVIIDRIPYIGYLSIPALELELPIISTWDYQLLNAAPCRYVGTVKGEDLVLMAHNYESHFGKLSQLKTGDAITFTDMDGEITLYEVVGEDILNPTDVEEMIAGVFDLTLFTCTYGGEYRVTVYCDKVNS